MSIIENSQFLMEKDREQLLQETMYYKTLEMLEERASKFDENIPYLRSKLDAKKNSKNGGRKINICTKTPYKLIWEFFIFRRI